MVIVNAPRELDRSLVLPFVLAMTPYASLTQCYMWAKFIRVGVFSARQVKQRSVQYMYGAMYNL